MSCGTSTVIGWMPVPAQVNLISELPVKSNRAGNQLSTLPAPAMLELPVKQTD